MDKIKRVAIIGGGASGLMAAVSAARRKAAVTVIEGNEYVGKKLLATGNGRCNFTNTDISPEDYNSPEDGFVSSVLSQFSADAAREYFESIGLLSRVEAEGRCYPYSGQAASLSSALEREAKRLGVELVLGDRAVKVAVYNGIFSVVLESGAELEADSLVIACGGRAGLQYGSTGDGYGFAKSLGHTLVPPRPALVPVESPDAFMKELRGVRAKAEVTLVKDGVPVRTERGEVQFTGTGVSGICVFDLTRYMKAPRPPKRNKSDRIGDDKRNSEVSGTEYENYEIFIDFMPEKTEAQIKSFIKDQMHRSGDRQVLRDALSGIINFKLADVLSKLASPDRAVSLVKRFGLRVSGTKGWENAQVTCGGVRRSDIDPYTMESLLMPGLFFCGEVVDVDGRCGGYNLQWAWASGVIGGGSAAGEMIYDTDESDKDPG